VETLTPRETEVFAYVSKGLMNKQIAYEMKISEIMVKLHRGRMMKKLQARSLVDVVRKFDQIYEAPGMEIVATRPLVVEDLHS
jgi:FixJ family two-component response regulator